MVSWIKDYYDPDQIAQKIEASRITADGTSEVRFKAFEHKEYSTLLYSMLKFQDDIPEIEARRIINEAISKVAEKGVIAPQSLLTEINRSEKEYLNLPCKRFVLASSLSLKKSDGLQRIKINGNVTIFEPYLPKRFQLEAFKATRDAEYSLFAERPTDYLSIRVFVSAKSTHQAVDIALNTMDLIRGIWNWFYNRRHRIRMTFGGPPDPVNKIVLGPLHTLHELNGKLATTGTWWYEPRYYGAIKPQNFTSDQYLRQLKGIDRADLGNPGEDTVKNNRLRGLWK